MPPPSNEELAKIYSENYGAYQEGPNERNIDAMRLLRRIVGDCKRPTTLDWLKLTVVEWIAGRSIPLRYGLALMLDRESCVLDYGCGTGADLMVLSAIGFSRLYGFDIVENPTARAALPFVDFRYGVVREAHYEPGMFDLITLIHVLEHLRDPVASLKELVPLLSTGGYMVIEVPNISGWVSTFGC